MNQSEFADRCGVTKRSQIRFEQDEGMPGGEYLQRLAGLGIDVTVLLTGTGAAPQGDGLALTPEERALIDNYRAASPDRRAALREVGAAVAQPLKGKIAK